MRTSNLRFGLLVGFLSVWLVQEVGAQPFVGGLKKVKGRDVVITRKIDVTEEMAKLPHSVSYEAFCPTAGNQNGKATTVAYATAYYLRTILENQARNIRQVEAVNNNRFSPAYLYNRIKAKEDVACDVGVDLETALQSLKNEGVPLLKSVKEQACGVLIPATVSEEAARYRIGDFTRLFGQNDSPLIKRYLLKKTLAQGTPVVIEFQAPESFTLAKNVWARATNETLETAPYGLALCVIAYDDSLAGGAFRVVNSWGSSWANQGKCWIRYEDMPAFTTAAYRVMTASATIPMLSGQVDIRFQNNQPMPVSIGSAAALPAYQPTGAYPAGQEIKLYASTTQPAYLYVFVGETKGVTRYVPADDNPPPALRSGELFVFPAVDQTITLSKAPGTDYLLFLFCRQPIADVAALTKQLQQAAGTPEQKVASALSDQPIGQVQYTPNAMTFSITTDKTALFVPILIRL